ncbi:MAG: hypothetical protein H7Z75_15670 [Ferruginibacter sp.]|nr:hypothetical protein [Cytophagales bacterium]
MKILWKKIKRSLTGGACLMTISFVLSLTACADRTNRAEDGQGAGTQGDQGTHPAQGPYTGAGQGTAGGADTLGDNPPSGNVDVNPTTDPGNRAQQADTLDAYRATGPDSANAVNKANKRQRTREARQGSDSTGRKQ